MSWFFILVSIFILLGVILPGIYIWINLFSKRLEWQKYNERLISYTRLDMFIAVMLVWASAFVMGDGSHVFSDIMYAMMEIGWLLVALFCIGAIIWLRVKKPDFWDVTRDALRTIRNTAILGFFLSMFLKGLS